jgi:hypothetical protein
MLNAQDGDTITGLVITSWQESWEALLHQTDLPARQSAVIFCTLHSQIKK